MLVVEATMLTDGSTLVDVISISLLVAVGVDTQARSLVMITVTTSPSCRVVVVKVGEFVPALVPLTCHWYDGLAPPLTGVAVKVTEAPSQMLVVEATILTEGSTLVDVISISLL